MGAADCQHKTRDQNSVVDGKVSLQVESTFEGTQLLSVCSHHSPRCTDLRKVLVCVVSVSKWEQEEA